MQPSPTSSKDPQEFRGAGHAVPDPRVTALAIRGFDAAAATATQRRASPSWSKPDIVGRSGTRTAVASADSRQARGARSSSLAPRAVGAVMLLVALAGCPPHPHEMIPFEPLPMDEAIEIVNRNSRQLQGTLKAKAGHARGHFISEDGRRRTFDMDAALLVCAPRCLRLDLSVLGRSQLIFGSNAQKYWMVRPPENTLSWGRHQRAGDPCAGDVLISPDLLLEALGMTPLAERALDLADTVQRITPDYQQLLFIHSDENAPGYIAKEYWLSRYHPQLVARVIFRDAMGQVVMDARLGRYAPVANDRPLLPHRIEMVWPVADSRILFTAAGWTILPHVDETHPGFAWPIDRGESFDRIVDLDTTRGTSTEHQLPATPEQ